MISQLNPQSIAISINGIDTSYNKLQKLIQQETINFDHKSNVYFLEASYTVSFITKLFKCFELNIPCLVHPKGFDEKRFKLIKELASEHRPHADCSLILLTSGSQGMPKAVQISKQNILANTEAIKECLDFNEVESQALFLPLSYSFGLIGQLLTALSLGKTTYLVDHFIKLKKLVETKSINMISGVPSHYWNILKLLKPQASLTHLVSAGAPMNLALRKSLKKHFSNASIYNNYGQTELTPRALCLSSKDPDFLSDKTGRIVKNLSYQILNEEIQFKGPQVMLGYLGEVPLAKDHWLKTGDLASEENGVITILGRRDDLIKVDGVRLSLKFIEDSIASILGNNQVACLHTIENSLSIYIEKQVPNTKQILDINQRIGISTAEHDYQKIDKLPLLENGKIDKKSLLK